MQRLLQQDHDDDNDTPNAEPTIEYQSHVVLPDDTLNGLCLKYKITPTQLRRANCFSGSNLALAPARLRIPVVVVGGERTTRSNDNDNNIRETLNDTERGRRIDGPPQPQKPGTPEPELPVLCPPQPLQDTSTPSYKIAALQLQFPAVCKPEAIAYVPSPIVCVCVFVLRTRTLARI